jgi:hypothetical protein
MSIRAHRATPTIKLLERRNANGSSGSAISPHNSEISAVITERLGNFLNDDLAPNVAASLNKCASCILKLTIDYTYQSRPNPLSLRDSSSAVKNIV